MQWFNKTEKVIDKPDTSDLKDKMLTHIPHQLIYESDKLQEEFDRKFPLYHGPLNKNQESYDFEQIVKGLLNGNR